jgi:hypothetical protein
MPSPSHKSHHQRHSAGHRNPSKRSHSSNSDDTKHKRDSTKPYHHHQHNHHDDKVHNHHHDDKLHKRVRADHDKDENQRRRHGDSKKHDHHHDSKKNDSKKHDKHNSSNNHKPRLQILTKKHAAAAKQCQDYEGTQDSHNVTTNHIHHIRGKNQKKNQNAACRPLLQRGTTIKAATLCNAQQPNAKVKRSSHNNAECYAELIRRQHHLYQIYVKNAEQALRAPLKMTPLFRPKAECEEKELRVVLKEGTIRRICEQLIYNGRFHSNCCVQLEYSDYYERVYLQGNSRWGVDLTVVLTKEDFVCC